MRNVEDHVLIKDFKLGQRIQKQYFYVLEVSDRVTRQSERFLILTLSDRSGQIRCTLWKNNFGHLFDAIHQQSYILVEGVVSEYNGSPQFEPAIIENCIVIPEEFIVCFEKIADIDVEEYRKRLQRYIESLENNHIGALAKAIFREENDHVLKLFCESTAASKMHHAYRHGLLKHTVNILDAADAILKIDYYKNFVNRDEVIFGVMVHDIGKIWQYEKVDFDYKYSAQGNLLGHIVIGVMLIDRISRSLNVPSELRMRLIHNLAAHHGILEWGSPVTPYTPEAYMIHTLENFDSKMVAFEEALAANDGSREFSDWNLVLNSRIYFGIAMGK